MTISVPKVVDLKDPANWQYPDEVWRAAHEQHPTAVTTTGEPVILRAEHFDALLTDSRFATMGLAALERLGITDGPFYQWRSQTMNVVDGAAHARLRSLVSRAFTPRRVDRLRDTLRGHARHLLDQCAETGEGDLVADYAYDLPLLLIIEFLGLDPGAQQELDRFLIGTEEGFSDPMTDEARDRSNASILALYGYVDKLIEERTSEPREDLVTDLLEAEREGRASRDEVRALVVNIIGGAVGSSRSAISSGLLLLLRNPEQAGEIRRDPEKMRPAVEEVLRYYPPFRFGRRRVTADVEAFGLSLKAGDTVLLTRQGANRDPRRWSQPDRFDISRAPQRHYSFSYGPHLCLGQAIARIDIQEALGVFLERYPEARLTTDDITRAPFTVDERWNALPVDLGPAHDD